MTTAIKIVDALLGDEEDPKDFILEPRTAYDHAVWDVTTKDLRQVMRNLGYRTTSAYRRKRGSVAVVAEKPVGEHNEWVEQQRVQHYVEEWLERKFPETWRNMRVHVWVHNVEEWDAEHKPVRNGNTFYATVEVIKHNDEMNPYA